MPGRGSSCSARFATAHAKANARSRMFCDESVMPMEVHDPRPSRNHKIQPNISESAELQAFIRQKLPRAHRGIAPFS
jgi:hypothetical protein